jgi:hypothetical protein
MIAAIVLVSCAPAPNVAGPAPLAVAAEPAVSDARTPTFHDGIRLPVDKPPPPCEEKTRGLLWLASGQTTVCCTAVEWNACTLECPSGTIVGPVLVYYGAGECKNGPGDCSGPAPPGAGRCARPPACEGKRSCQVMMDNPSCDDDCVGHVKGGRAIATCQGGDALMLCAFDGTRYRWVSAMSSRG